jgi:sulfite reductase (NADPH) hemoprotein beta-component
MEGVADIADAYSQGEIRVSHEQNLVLPHVAVEDLPAVWRALGRLGFAEANVGKITDIIACPGLDYCALANARSIPVAQRISNHFAELARQHDIGDLKIKISGCINACGHHHVGHIGILGRRQERRRALPAEPRRRRRLRQDRARRDPRAGGRGRPGGRGGRCAGRDLSRGAPAGERFVDTYRRIGAQPFKERVYGNP